MLLTYIIFITALSLSAVAAYYSIIGLTAIFAAAVFPVAVMGSVLEVAKLVTTVWLHEYWDRIKLAMKLYLVPAVILLMFITSMGIFGFLSKAHIEQTATGTENIAQIEQITAELTRKDNEIKLAEAKLQQLTTTGNSANSNIQSQIDAEQARIDSAYTRVQPRIDNQLDIIKSRAEIYTAQIAAIDTELENLQKYIDSNEFAKAQALVGTKADGRWGPATAANIQKWKADKNDEKQKLLLQIKSLEDTDSVVKSARAEIQKIKQSAETQVSGSIKLIDRLRAQLGQQGSLEDLTVEIEQQKNIIKTLTTEVADLTTKKFSLESEYRKIEAEVGPVKYIAEFVYGDTADKNMLEQAVRWVIIILVLVFDPLAVMLLLAYTESRKWNKSSDSTNFVDSIKKLISFLKLPKHEEAIKNDVAIYNIDPVSVKNTQLQLLNNSEPVTIYSNTGATLLPAAETVNVTSNIDVNQLNKNEVDPESIVTNNDEVANDYLSTVTPDTKAAPPVSIGKVLPESPVKGYMFVNTDHVPTKLFKFNGDKWIRVDKETTDAYLSNEEYIEFLMKKIESGEYDPELLTEAELIEIEKRLQQDSK